MLYHRLAPAAACKNARACEKNFSIIFMVEEPRIYQPHNEHAACLARSLSVISIYLSAAALTRAIMSEIARLSDLLGTYILQFHECISYVCRPLRVLLF